MAKKDPYEPDMEILSGMEKSSEFSGGGQFCPRMNKSIGGKCKVCDYVTSIFTNKQKYPEKSEARNFAKQKMAKSSWYLTYVTEDDPNTPKVLRIGSMLGSAIIEGIKKLGWTGIINPGSNKGREMMVSKTVNEHGRNRYTPSPVMEKVEWEIPEEVLENLPNLDQRNLIKMIENEEIEVEDITSIKKDDTFTFRICPPWTTGSEGEDNRWFMQILWKHWGVTEDQIKGEASISWKEETEDVESDVQGKELFDDKSSTADDSKAAKEEKTTKKKNNKPSCFGKERFFDKKDDICQDCTYIDDCMAEVKGE